MVPENNRWKEAEPGHDILKCTDVPGSDVIKSRSKEKLESGGGPTGDTGGPSILLEPMGTYANQFLEVTFSFARALVNPRHLPVCSLVRMYVNSQRAGSVFKQLVVV